REDVSQRALPLCGVRSRPETLRCCGVQDGFDPPAYPAGGFWLGAPDRIEHPHDEPGVDSRDRQLAENRVNMLFEGLRPLARVLCAPPRAPVLCQIFDRALPKGTPSGFGKPLRLPLGAPRFERINTALAELPMLGGQCAGIRQRDIRE